MDLETWSNMLWAGWARYTVVRRLVGETHRGIKSRTARGEVGGVVKYYHHR
jgi:hypothetical protein